MQTDPLTGSRYPSGNDAANIAQYFQNAVTDLADNTIPRFATTTARDTAYAAYVAAGGSMANGMTCWCDSPGAFYDRLDGAWVKRTNNAGSSGALAGVALPAEMYRSAKTYYASIVLNAFGDGTVIYPGGAFDNGVVDVTVQHVSQGAAPSNNLTFRAWSVGMASTNVRCYSPGGAVFGGTGVAAVVRIEGW